MKMFEWINKAYTKWCLNLLLILFLSATLLLFFSGCKSNRAEKVQTTGTYYTCPMHPQVHEDKPGKCPICGMTLVKVMPGMNQNMQMDSMLSFIAQPVNEVVAGNFKVITPHVVKANDTIEVYGNIAFDSSETNSVSTLVSGRIQKLFIKYNHRQIHKGQPLMEIYSPELLTIQRQLQQAMKDNERMLMDELEKQLLNLGMSASQIQQLKTSNDVIPYITIFSPYNGISSGLPANEKASSNNNDGMGNMGGMSSEKPQTSSADIASSSLNLHEGMYVAAGQTVFTIQNINQTWAILDVFNQDFGKIHTGDKVLLYSDANKEKVISGKIDFIPPYRISGEKTTSVRVFIPSIWKIGTLIHGKIISQNKISGWRVPATAVTRLGLHTVVWVQNNSHPGIYQRREVNIGEETNDQVFIHSGINEGDKIVENAAYMVGSDNFIQ